MKKIKFWFALLMFGALLQSCTGDIQDLEDPRDAIVNKDFRVVETDKTTDSDRSYTDKIIKDANDKTQIIFTNFHDEKVQVKATLAGSSIEIKKQDIPGSFIVEGSGSVNKDLNGIILTYTIDDGTTAKPIQFQADYNPPSVTKKVEKDVIQ